MNVAIANILEFQCIIVITRGRNVENKLAPPAYNNSRKKQKNTPFDPLRLCRFPSWLLTHSLTHSLRNEIQTVGYHQIQYSTVR